MDYREAAQTLEQSLRLTLPPIAVCLVEEAPSGVGAYCGPPVPGGYVLPLAPDVAAGETPGVLQSLERARGGG